MKAHDAIGIILEAAQYELDRLRDGDDQEKVEELENAFSEFDDWMDSL